MSSALSACVAGPSLGVFSNCIPAKYSWFIVLRSEDLRDRANRYNGGSERKFDSAANGSKTQIMRQED